jgi:hypothetical protein
MWVLAQTTIVGVAFYCLRRVNPADTSNSPFATTTSAARNGDMRAQATRAIGG